MRRSAVLLAFAAGGLLTVGGSGCHSITKPKTSSELLLTERMAQVLLRDNQPVDAERAFREVLKYDSKNAEALGGLGNALIMQGRFKEAMPYLDKAVSLDPMNGSFRNNRGVARMEQGEYKEAGEDFDAAESSPNPDDKISASINRGRLRQRQGDFAAAEHEFTMALAYLQRAIDLDPTGDTGAKARLLIQGTPPS
jgi:Tfp pilus assembly protein PilF